MGGQTPFGGRAFGENTETQADPRQLLGERITFKLTNGRQESRNFHFTVVGILDENNRERAWQAFASLDDIEKMAHFMQRSNDRRSSIDEERTYDYILLRTEDVGRATELAKELREIGYNASTMAELLEGIEQTTRVIQAVLGGIGSVALLVAALGITNTMVMSIYERTKEIGIIKVIGATNADVSALFLTEAAIIGILGGFFGIVFSYGASLVINRFAGNFINIGMAGAQSQISVIPPWLALFAIAFAMAIGILSGVLPAQRAVKLSPIDAIRQS
jgi:ABC-type antimicrobial peptide transport system permease subunit